MDLLITLATYILGFFAAVLTIGLVAWVFLVLHIWSEYKKPRANLDDISKQIERNRSSFGKPNRHKIDL